MDDRLPTIRKAILGRRSLSAIYENHLRYFSPHALGRDRTGRHIVVGYQYDGGHPKGLPATGDWCFFEVPRMIGVAVNADPWRTAHSTGPEIVLEIETAISPDAD